MGFLRGEEGWREGEDVGVEGGEIGELEIGVGGHDWNGRDFAWTVR